MWSVKILANRSSGGAFSFAATATFVVAAARDADNKTSIQEDLPNLCMA